MFSFDFQIGVLNVSKHVFFFKRVLLFEFGVYFVDF